jgi:hypothetical protein
MQGKSYFVRLRGLNVCGWSDYFPWNDIRAVTYIHTYIHTVHTVHIYIDVLYIHACINSYIKLMKENIIELFGVGHRALQQRVSGVCMYVSQCLCVSMYGLDWKCRRYFIINANSKYTVCMCACVLVRW